MIKEAQPSVKSQPQSSHLGPDWVMATASIKLVGQVNALHSSGKFFTHEQEIELKSLDLLEYGQATSHNHSTGGDVKMQAYEVVDKFYADSNIQDIYVYMENKEIDLFLVLHEELDMMSLRLAKLQRKIAKSHPDLLIEIIYTTREFFTYENVPDGSELYPRRK